MHKFHYTARKRLADNKITDRLKYVLLFEFVFNALEVRYCFTHNLQYYFELTGPQYALSNQEVLFSN